MSQDKILKYLSTKPGRKTAREIAEAININNISTNANLKQLRRFEEVNYTQLAYRVYTYWV